MVERKQIEEITDGRAVDRDVGIIIASDRIREIIAAPIRQRLKVPVPLDELQDRDMVGVGVADMATRGERRDDDQGNPGPVAEEIDRLDVARVKVAATLVHGDDESGGGE